MTHRFFGWSCCGVVAVVRLRGRGPSGRPGSAAGDDARLQRRRRACPMGIPI